MSSPITVIEFKGALYAKKKAELTDICVAMMIHPLPTSKIEMVKAIGESLKENKEIWSNDPRFKKLYVVNKPGRPSQAHRDSTPGSSSSPNPNAKDEDDDGDHVPSSHSPEEQYLQPSSSSKAGPSSSSNGIPKGRELPRSPIKQVTDSLPALAIPGSVKKLASSIFSRPVAAAEDLVEKVQAAEEYVEEELAAGRRSSLRVARKAKEAVVDAEQSVEHQAVVAVDQAEVLMTKAKGFWQDKVWTPSGNYFSTQSNQTLLLLTLETLALLSSTLLFKTLTLTFPPSLPRFNPNSAQAPIAGEYNIDNTHVHPLGTHVLRNDNVNHPWLALDVRTVDWRTSFQGWDTSARLGYPTAIWFFTTIFVPAVLAALIGSKSNKGGKTLVFWILRLAVYAALATQAGNAGGLISDGLRATGLANGLGLVASGTGVLLGFAKGLGGQAE